MIAWWIVSGVLLVSLIPCGVLCLWGDMVNRLVGLEIAGIIITMLLLTLSIAYGRDSFLDLSLAMALVSFGGGLVFARFIERWL